MNIAENEIHEAAIAIQTCANSQGMLDLLDRLISRQEGPRVVSELISRERATGATEEEAVTQVLATLESVANVSKPIACILMASLWPIAG